MKTQIGPFCKIQQPLGYKGMAWCCSLDIFKKPSHPIFQNHRLSGCKSILAVQAFPLALNGEGHRYESLRVESLTIESTIQQ